MTLDEQEDLIQLLKKQTLPARREPVLQGAAKPERDFAEGRYEIMTADEIVDSVRKDGTNDLSN